MTRSPLCASRWPLERALFAMAGTVTLLSAVLGAAVSLWFLVLVSLVLMRVFGLRSATQEVVR
ncbi:MAG: hypothetical protein M3130_12000 [Actinomycetota bacterium]|nr:hypothetical protein [Actinomycetota bacterium]MDQ6935990.1 hypothetical protein [Actinomycetota bacterium]